jgi:hypothetical protein
MTALVPEPLSAFIMDACRLAIKYPCFKTFVRQKETTNQYLASSDKQRSTKEYVILQNEKNLGAFTA